MQSYPSGEKHSPEILVEFPEDTPLRGGGLERVDVAEKSVAAIDEAMASIKRLGGRITGAVAEFPTKPTGVEVEFGVKLGVEGNAFLAKSAAEAHLHIKLAWEGWSEGTES